MAFLKEAAVEAEVIEEAGAILEAGHEVEHNQRVTLGRTAIRGISQIWVNEDSSIEMAGTKATTAQLRMVPSEVKSGSEMIFSVYPSHRRPQQCPALEGHCYRRRQT